MKAIVSEWRIRRYFLLVFTFLFASAAFDTVAHAAFTINVRTAGGNAVTDYKWLVQEDNTYDAAGHLGIYNNYSSISVGIHKSSAKVLATGTGANPIVNLPANGRYFVSVMASGYTLTGGAVRPNQVSVNLTVHQVAKQRAAQISLMIFHDNNPINGAPDAEALLPDFRIVLYDTFGQQSQDAWGNPLGTVYETENGEAKFSGDKPVVKMMGLGYVMSSATAGRVVLPDGSLSAPVPGLVGNALIQNLAPGKYGVRAIPTDGRPWVQTATIEGTPGIDNWVMAGEPTYYTEAGFFGVHSFIGFVLPTDYNVAANLDPAFSMANVFRPLNPSVETYGQISGQVVQNRINRPPQQMGLNPGEPVPEAYIGLSEFGASQRQVFVLGCPGTARHPSGDAALKSTCDSNANFQIRGVPPGTYTLTMWDKPLDQIIDFRTITIPAVAPPGDSTKTTVALGQLPVFQWFGVYEGSYFFDTNLNGKRDPGEQGIPNLASGIRYRDGSPYQSTVSLSDGGFALTEVFPFFKWLVADSDYSRFYPTGATVYVDKGGKSLFNTADNSADGNSSLLEVRTDPPGPGSLLEGMILYFDNTLHIDWGRVPYPVTLPGSTTPITNGGISGLVTYAFTRAAGDPSLGAQSPWEPGQGNVTLKLWKPTGFDANGKPKFDPPYDKPIAETVSDSWDRFVYDDDTPQPDNRRNKGLRPQKGQLTGCLDTIEDAGLSITPQGIPLNKYIDCSESIPSWNQSKLAVYDGGWIFTEYTDPADGTTKPLPAGQYVVEVVPPAGYEVAKEEDQNFAVSGDTYLPSKPQPAALPPKCVGPDHTVPQFLTFDGVTPAPYAGQNRPLCNMKLIDLQDGQNAAAEFRIFTQVPLAARIIGLVTDDLALEFRPGNPRLGDKPGPSFMPISIQDYTGHELVRTYTDEWGIFNTLVPSTYTTNVPNPTGVSPHIVKIILNHPGFDPVHPDPWYNAGYPTPEWKMDVWPGKITYADTPIVPIRPQIGAAALDCALQDGTPVIDRVDGPGPQGGPWVANPADPAANTVTITAVGNSIVRNPDPNVSGTSLRDYGFGAKTGIVTLNGAKLPVDTWTNSVIKVTVPAGAATGQLEITRGDSLKTTITGITLHIGGTATYINPPANPSDVNQHPIQDAIDAALPGALLLISPGIYAENLIMNKPVKLQGYGANSTFIKAGFFTPEKKAIWDAKLAATLVTTATSTYSTDPDNNPVPVFDLDSGAGIMVLGRHDRSTDPVPAAPSVFAADDFNLFPSSRIDGLSITGATLGGGIFVHAYAHNLKITNNKLTANQGTYGGGIRIGTPGIVENAATNTYRSSFNDNVLLGHNEVVANGGVGVALSSGGGIGLYEGSDNYEVSDSWICGNYAALAGAGIAHQGLSSPAATQAGVITRNTIIFNEAFDEGAGIFIGGETPTSLAVASPVSPGAGNVIINRNLIQGNKAGNLGGGIGLLRYNGKDVAGNPTNDTADPDGPWYRAKIYNNMITNNISGGYGGGIAIFDAVNTDIVFNTIANNDTTATGELAFGNVPFVEGPFALIDKITTPTPAGISVQPVSAALLAQIDTGIRAGYTTYTTAPVIVNNIITGNFARYWANPGVNQIATLTDFGYWDVGIFGSADPAIKLHPKFCLLTDPTLTPLVETKQQGGSDNRTGNPLFVSPYRNVINAFQGGATLGNFVTFSYSPMNLKGDYHVAGTSPAVSFSLTDGATPVIFGVDPADTGIGGMLNTDFDDDVRPIKPGKNPDIGADEHNTKGDVDNDGKITMVDVLILLNQLVLPPSQRDAGIVAGGDIFPLSPKGKPQGGDGFTLSDVLLLLQRAMGMIIW